MIRLPKNLRLREPLLIIILIILASILFAVTHAYTQAYDRRRTELGQQWFDSALAELRSGSANSAVEGFQTALSYAPANWDYRLELARALTAANRTAEARAYYQTLWQTNPDDGSVNLQLARLAVQNGTREEAERYFNGAIFGIWESDAAENRRAALFEMIDFYLRQNNYGAADSELTVLSANIPEDPNTHARVAGLFLRVNDNARALTEFRSALLRDPKNPATLRGAGEAAFRLGRYRDAKSFLDSSLRFGPENQFARDLLATINAILSLNPLESRIPSWEKAQRIVRGFQIAGDRLNACMMQLQAAPANPSSIGLGEFSEKWMMLAPMVQELKLRNDADLSQEAMELTFSIEQQTSTLCGPPPAGPDMALLTIAQARPKDQ
ncbi:MAG TPA: tetratricopeptide repeat protein [Terriglobia bacterium]|jgi:tetratricopeptide (TPR) repeat protein